MLPDEAPAAPTRTVRFPDVMRSLRKGAPFALTLAVVAAVVAVLVTQRLDPVYQASASLLASQPGSSYGGMELLTPPSVDPRVYQRALLEGPVVHDALQRIDGVDRSPAQMERFLRKVRVSVENQQVSSVVTISVRDSNAQQAADYANAIAAELAAWDRNRARQLVENGIAALERSIADIDAAIAEAVEAPDQASAMREQALNATLREQRVRELEAARARNASAVVVGLLVPINEAEAPPQAIGPRLVFNTFVAAVLGLLLGYALQFARWSLSNAVRDRSTLAGLTNSPVLAVFPRATRSGKRLAAEPASFFRANLLRSVRDRQPAVVGITSAADFDEKAGVAVALAEGLGRSGYRTLLIDADLRRRGPGLGVDIGNMQTPGLEAYLQNPAMSFQPVTMSAEGRWSFNVLPTRSPARQPSELIEYGFGTLLNRVRDLYDVVVVDLPPVLAYADALAAAPAMTGLVLCAGVDTDVQQVREGIELLEVNEVELLGTVLTGAAAARGSRPALDAPAGQRERFVPGRNRPTMPEAPSPRAVARVKNR